MTTSPATELKRTVLHALHLSLGAKMVPFAGYEMPVQYPTGILKEHRHTREAAGLFDVSHMGQAFLMPTTGDPAAALEKITPADIAGLRECRMRYALLLNDRGGVKDDFMAARLPLAKGALHLVVNAATKDSDFAYIAEETKGKARLEPQPNRALLALQGPKAEAVLARHAPGVAELGFMKLGHFTVAGAAATVTRSGYTGEDGFEISLDERDTEGVARTLLSEPEVLPIGLGARDSLRLEAGLPLYGHELDETISPIAAGLGWSIGKRRKVARDFLAADILMTELLEGTPRRRVGLTILDKAPAREGAEIVDATLRPVGRITSGGFSPTLNTPIAMGYVETELAADGTELAVLVREMPRKAVVTPMPFVPHRYKRRPME